jgi:hypothetical protein
LKLNYDRQSVSSSWCQAPIWDLRPISPLLEIFFRQLRVCYFVAPSLTRGRVCNLLLLLVLASAVSLGFEFRGTQDHILLCQLLRLFQPEGPGSRIYIPQEQGGPDIPGHWVPFPSPLTIAYFTFIGVGVLLAADSQSTSTSGYRASLWDP